MRTLSNMCNCTLSWHARSKQIILRFQGVHQIQMHIFMKIAAIRMVCVLHQKGSGHTLFRHTGIKQSGFTLSGQTRSKRGCTLSSHIVNQTKWLYAFQAYSIRTKQPYAFQAFSIVRSHFNLTNAVSRNAKDVPLARINAPLARINAQHAP